MPLPKRGLGAFKKKATDQRRRAIIHLVRRGRQVTHYGLKNWYGGFCCWKRSGKAFNNFLPKWTAYHAFIRTYEKLGRDEFDRTVTDVLQKDPQRMKLISIFADQIELLVNEGRPSSSRFMDSLKSNNITLPSEVLLRTKFCLESVSHPSTNL
jgi:hypothetical protein